MGGKTRGVDGVGAERERVTAVDESGTELSKGEIFEVLENERRRHTLQYLRRNGGPVSLGDLATAVAAREYDTNPADVSGAQRKRVYTTLQQTHLPRMDDAGVVAYDSENNVVDATPHTEELTVYLEVVPGGEFPWRELYLSLGMVCLAVVVVLWAGIPPFTAVPALVWATLFAVALTGAAAYHTFLARELTLAEFDAATEDFDGE